MSRYIIRAAKTEISAVARLSQCCTSNYIFLYTVVPWERFIFLSPTIVLFFFILFFFYIFLCLRCLSRSISLLTFLAVLFCLLFLFNLLSAFSIYVRRCIILFAILYCLFKALWLIYFCTSWNLFDEAEYNCLASARNRDRNLDSWTN